MTVEKPTSLRSNKPKTPITLTLSPDEEKALRKLARENGRSISAELVHLATDFAKRLKACSEATNLTLAEIKQIAAGKQISLHELLGSFEREGCIKCP